MAGTLIQITRVRILERIRKDNGEINELARSIDEHGLINPITVMENEDGFVLLAGFRRLKAMTILGWKEAPATVLSPRDAEEQLSLEIEENETRKDFTASQRVEYAQKIRVIQEEKARKRMGQHNKPSVKGAGSGRGDCLQERGGPERRSKDEIAKRVGFKSGRQLDRASYLAKERPDLMEKVDNGKASITGAYEEAKGITRKPKMENPQGLPKTVGYINGKLAHIGGELDRPEDFTFILGAVQSAAKYYLAEIQGAANRYSEVMQSDENSKAISDVLRSTFWAAADAFGDNYIEEEEE